MFIFYVTPIPNQPPLYLGLYVNGFVYFLMSNTVKRKSKEQFSSKIGMDLNGPVIHFLGIKFRTTHNADRYVNTKLTQEVLVDTIRKQAGLKNKAVSKLLIPYQSDCPLTLCPSIHPLHKHNKNSKILPFKH